MAAAGECGQELAHGGVLPAHDILDIRRDAVEKTLGFGSFQSLPSLAPMLAL
jgi:hypothetical protein